MICLTMMDFIRDLLLANFRCSRVVDVEVYSAVNMINITYNITDEMSYHRENDRSECWSGVWQEVVSPQGLLQLILVVGLIVIIIDLLL